MDLKSCALKSKRKKIFKSKICNENFNMYSSESGYSSGEELLPRNYCEFCRKNIGGPRSALIGHLGTRHTNVPLQKLGEKIRLGELHLVVKVRNLAIQRFLNL